MAMAGLSIAHQCNLPPLYAPLGITVRAAEGMTLPPSEPSLWSVELETAMLAPRAAVGMRDDEQAAAAAQM
jgi:hypothetical protein